MTCQCIGSLYSPVAGQAGGLESSPSSSQHPPGTPRKPAVQGGSSSETNRRRSRPESGMDKAGAFRWIALPPPTTVLRDLNPFG
jgi:hypothetical protein